jgi:putative Holliday junction resolvase
MNVLAIDFGLQRIGLSLGSTESGIAFTRPALQNCCAVINSLMTILTDEEIHHILLGLPLKRDGRPGDIDDALQGFYHQLSDKTNLTIEWSDERYTSKIADVKIRDLDLKKSKRVEIRKSGEKDSIAAQVLLQEWLDENS